MRTYAISLIFDEGSSVEFVDAENVKEALKIIKNDINEDFEVHSIYSEEIK